MDSAGAGLRTALLLMAVAMATFVLPASASATVFKGTVADPVGDATGPDLTGVIASYDNVSGEVTFQVKLVSPATVPTQVATGLGSRTASGACSIPLLVLGGFLPEATNSLWLLEKDGSTPAEEQGEATMSVTGSTVTLKAKDSRLKGFTPDCAETILSETSNPENVYDRVDTFAVRPPPPKPALKAKAKSPGALKRGASGALRISVTNTGKARANAVRVKLRTSGPATVRPGNRRIGSIAPGKTRTVSFRIKVNKRAKGQVKINARVTGRKVKAKATTSFRVKLPPPPARPSDGGLAGKMFWGFESYRFDRSADLVFLHFTSRNLVRWGLPKKGLKNCGKPNARMKDGEMQPGCLRYSFNRRTGRVQFGKVKGTFRSGGLKLKMDDDVWNTDGSIWYRGLTARPGTRFKTKLINRGFFGACGITPYCTTWAENLQLTRDGRFGRQNSSLTTGGTPGVSFVAISQLGPDERGRYRVLSGGRIRFDYANGKKVTETSIVQTNKRGRPDPVRKGLLIGDTWFYREDD